MKAAMNFKNLTVQCDDEDLIDSILDDSGQVDYDAALEASLDHPSKVRFVNNGEPVVLSNEVN
jgi:hypothetical protein